MENALAPPKEPENRLVNPMSRKKRQKIGERFVPLPHSVLDSPAFQSLKHPSSKVAYLYFLKDRKNGHQTEVILTFGQAQKYGVCKSPDTFNQVKRELVDTGFLDPLEPGGLNQPSVFTLSFRWKLYGTSRFEKVKYKPGVGCKYFTKVWKDKELRQKLIKARHGKT